MNTKNNFISFEGFHLSVSIETPHYLSEYVEYPIRLTFSPNEYLPGESYIIVKRYSDFDTLKKSLKPIQFSTHLPPKKIFGKFDMNLVNERQILLEKYLKDILNTYLIGKSVPVTNFFQKSNDIIIDYSKLAFQQVSLDFRCETNWQIVKVLPEIGCRIGKAYLVVNNLSDARKHIHAWSEFGPEYSPLYFRACQKFLKTLTSLKHEFIYPIVHVAASETGVSVTRLFSELGSLHDFMYKTKPTNSIIYKYGAVNGKPNLLNELSLFGRQILLGLKYLHEKGIPYGHLHLRNVLMFNEVKCGLSDIENSVMGLISQDRHFFVGILKKLSFVEIDIYCFGRLIYEMIFGESLKSTFIVNDDTLKWPTPTIRDFLFSVLTEGALKTGFPTIDSLLDLTLFKSYSNKPIDKSSFKISPPCKEFLASTQQYSLKLLEVDQKLIKSQRRKLEADAITLKKKKQRKEESRRMKPTAIEGDISEDISPTPKSNQPSMVKSTSKPGETNSSTVSTVAVVGGQPPAPPAAPPAPPVGPVAPPASSNSSSSNPKVGQLLNAISGFNKSNLRKATTNDKSGPRI